MKQQVRLDEPDASTARMNKAALVEGPRAAQVIEDVSKLEIERLRPSCTERIKAVSGARNRLTREFCLQ